MIVVPARYELRIGPLETRRLVLEPIEVTDAADLWVATEESRAQLEPWLPWVPFNVDLEASVRYAEASANDWDLGRACRFTIRDKNSRRLLGVIGLEALANMPQSGELGYWLRTDETGRGYMTEAGHAAIAWSFDTLGLHRIRIAASTDNHPSLRVIGRLGFRFEGVAREAERVANRWLDHAVFALLASDPRLDERPRP